MRSASPEIIQIVELSRKNVFKSALQLCLKRNLWWTKVRNFDETNRKENENNPVRNGKIYTGIHFEKPDNKYWNP